jgi:two-component system NarL family sensor kinase
MSGTIFRIFFLFIVLSTFTLAAQNGRAVDSLEQVLFRYDAQNSKRGIKPSVRDSVKVNLLSDIISGTYDNYPDKAMVYAKELLSLSEEIGNRYGIGQACNALGSIYDQKSDYRTALAFYERALKMRKAIKLWSGVSDCYNNIAVIHTKQANYSLALQYMLEALTINKKANDDFGMAGTYNNLGVLYISQENYPEALKNFFNCLKILNRLDDDSTTSVIEQNIGEIYLRQSKTDEALLHFEKGLRLAKASGNLYSESNNYNSLAMVAEQKGQLDQALKYYENALLLTQKIDDGFGKAQSHLHIGGIFFKKGNTSKAIEYITVGLDMARKSGELELLQKGYQNLADIYNSTKNYKLAYKNHILYKQITDSIFNIDKREKFDHLQLKYDARIARDSLKAVQQIRENKLKDDAIVQRNERNVVYTILGLVMVFLIILLLQRSKIAKVKRQRALEEERNRISRDLHDNLGAQLSTVRMLMAGLAEPVSGNTQQIAKNSISLLDASINDLRNVMDEMQNAVLIEKGYLAATETLINNVKQTGNIQFSLSHHKMDLRAGVHIEHQLYRVTQELVNNTLKYAKAKTVSLELLRSSDGLTLMYEDDGVGFDMATVKKGYGLHNIEIRIKSIGGTVNFDSMPGAGMRVTIEIPE